MGGKRMSKCKSLITDYPERGSVFASLFYGIVSFAVGPFMLTFFGFGLQLDLSARIWIQFFYHLANALVVIYIFKEHLKDTFIYVQTEPRKFIARVADGVVLVLMAAAVVYGIGYKLENPFVMQGVLPTKEKDLFVLPSVMLAQQPIIGVLCMVLVTPFSTTLLYYATAFASTCSHNPIRAYIQMVFLLVIPGIVNGLTFWPMEEELILFAAQLPIHLLACRTYQKADSVWAPIATHMVVNLIACIALLFGL